MPIFQIKSYIDNTLLYEGKFQSLNACLEQAITDHTPLDNADLKNANLVNITLDDAELKGADFTGANLTGANLSEACLPGANFGGAALYNTCFAYSSLQHCNFENASFGGTDITGSDLSGSRFSSLSCFSLDFSDARSMAGCVFTTIRGIKSPMSQPPVVIRGLGNAPIILTDHHISHGHETLRYTELLKLLKPHFRLQDRKRAS